MNTKIVLISGLPGFYRDYPLRLGKTDMHRTSKATTQRFNLVKAGAATTAVFSVIANNR
jgi:hypothetical protein